MGDIPFIKPYVSERAAAMAAETLRSGWIGEGPTVREFEIRIGRLVGSSFPVAVNSGTSALHLALTVAGVGPRDEVLTTAQTMLATSQAILACGAVPVYADIQYGNGNLDPRDLAKRVTPRTRAILAVDWGGYPCDYDELLAVAQEHKLALVEDAAHALGATYHGRPVGSVCPYTCFSFQAIKHLTTGDGGLVCLPDGESYRKAMRLRWFGIDRERRQPSLLGEPVWNVTELGYKYHMNDVAAAVGLGNLEDWDLIRTRRHRIAEAYLEHLRSLAGVEHFERRGDRQHADWLFSMHVERRDDFCQAMKARNVQVSVVHLRIDRNALCGGERPDLPMLDRFTRTHISLPLHPLLSDEDVQSVVRAVRAGW